MELTSNTLRIFLLSAPKIHWCQAFGVPQALKSQLLYTKVDGWAAVAVDHFNGKLLPRGNIGDI